MSRSITRLLAAPFYRQHYVSIAKSFQYVDYYSFFIKRYISGKGQYPFTCRVRTPTGIVSLMIYQHEDTFTIQEVFGIDCYAARDEKVIVDFGANIGVSAAYFLTRNRNSFVYGFEPLPSNLEKLKRNLAAFEGRYEVTNAAVAAEAGTLTFRVEPTGRYSGVENLVGEEHSFPAVSATDELRRIAAQHGEIDLLKVDIEGAEVDIFASLDRATLSKVKLIYIEGSTKLELPDFRHSLTVSGIHRYDRIAA